MQNLLLLSNFGGVTNKDQMRSSVIVKVVRAIMLYDTYRRARNYASYARLHHSSCDPWRPMGTFIT